MYGEEGGGGGGGTLIVCLQKLYLTVTDMFKYLFCYVNFEKIKIKSNISIWSLLQHVNNSKKTKQLLGFKKPRKKIRQNKKAWFS